MMNMRDIPIIYSIYYIIYLNIYIYKCVQDVSRPELSAFAIEEEDVMLIISSDGITGSVSDVEAVRLASQALKEGGPDATERAGRPRELLTFNSY